MHTYSFSLNRNNTVNDSTTTVKKHTIHQVTTMLATSKNLLFPGHNHLLTTGADDPTLELLLEHQRR